MLDIYRAERSAVLWFGARSNDLSGENVKRRDKKFRPLPAGFFLGQFAVEVNSQNN